MSDLSKSPSISDERVPAAPIAPTAPTVPTAPTAPTASSMPTMPTLSILRWQSAIEQIRRFVRFYMDYNRPPLPPAPRPQQQQPLEAEQKPTQPSSMPRMLQTFRRIYGIDSPQHTSHPTPARPPPPLVRVKPQSQPQAEEPAQSTATPKKSFLAKKWSSFVGIATFKKYRQSEPKGNRDNKSDKIEERLLEESESSMSSYEYAAAVSAAQMSAAQVAAAILSHQRESIKSTQSSSGFQELSSSQIESSSSLQESSTCQQESSTSHQTNSSVGTMQLTPYKRQSKHSLKSIFINLFPPLGRRVSGDTTPSSMNETFLTNSKTESLTSEESTPDSKRDEDSTHKSTSTQ